jgi:transposase-like protein
MTKKRVKAQPGRKSRLSPDQQAELVALVDRGDLTVEQVAESAGVSVRSLYRWKARLETSEEATAWTAAERRDYKRVKRELAAAKLSIEILKKTLTFSRTRRP